MLFKNRLQTSQSQFFRPIVPTKFFVNKFMCKKVVNFCKFKFKLVNTQSMVDCKNFYVILYLIKKTGKHNIKTYQKGVMATGLKGRGSELLPVLSKRKLRD